MSAGGLQKRLLLLPSEGCAFRLPSLQKLCCGCGGRGAWGCAIPTSLLCLSSGHYEKNRLNIQNKHKLNLLLLFSKQRFENSNFCEVIFREINFTKNFVKLVDILKIVFGTQWVLYNSKKRRGRSKDQPHQRLVSTAVTSLIQGPDSWTVKPPPEKDENFLFNCCWRLRACVWFHEKNGDVAHTYS